MIKTNKDELLIGLISDTHIPSRGPQIPEVIIDDFKDNQIDYLFHLGDYENFKTYQNLIETFGTLPETLEFELYGRKIFMTHGTGGPNIVIKRLNRNHNLDPYDIIIFGHVHRPYNEIWRDGKLYLNPGTPTDRKFTDINSYGYLRISKDKVDPKIVYL
jgi:putative phosphoesterase